MYSISDWMIHLAWLDHCPNTVVEALSVGTPVVCTSAGGTAELLTQSAGFTRGVVLNESQGHALELRDYDHPPDIDMLIQNTKSLPDIDHDFPVNDLCIERCAKRYAAVLEGALQ
jgi:glycosyltransferase involved in cell wall biosynthesis